MNNQVRLLYAFVRQLFSSRFRLQHYKVNTNAAARPLFAPIITSSRSGPLECDYNLHKSNSTYFSDSDVGRLHLLIATMGKGVDRTRKELEREEREEKERKKDRRGNGDEKSSSGGSGGGGGSFGIRLGGVNANFRKEILPFEKFEIWTRVLAWDHKWLYIVQHFVRPGVKPKSYLLQPWRKSSGGGGGGAPGIISTERNDTAKAAAGSSNGHVTSATTGTSTSTSTETKPPGSSSSPAHSAIFASVIAKYVVKKGRRTIPPERVIKAAGLLPPKPEESQGNDNTTLSVGGITPDTTESTSIDATALSYSAVEEAEEELTPAAAEAMLEASMTAATEDEAVWDWKRIEEERRRGMKIAEVYGRLDALNDEFWGEGAEALGQY